MNSVDVLIGMNIAAAMAKHRVDAQLLAKAMGVPIATVKNWLAGKVRLSPVELCDVARLLDVSVASLYLSERTRGRAN